MQKETEIYLSPEQAVNENTLNSHIASQLRIKKSRVNGYEILKKALDARRKPIAYYYRIKVYIDEPKPLAETFTISALRTEAPTVYIIGAGPAGLFAALELLKHGMRPVIIERGKPVSERKYDIAQLNKAHLLNPDSNYCFGEGGAGTFSDGKLYTRSNKRGDIGLILKTFIAHGAPQHILYDAEPHIGTDVLPRVVTSMRETIQNHGGEFRFDSKLTDIIIKNKRVVSIVLNGNEEINTGNVILATGHSARDIYRMLHKNGIALEAKPFAAGVRIEHPQELINSIQYKGQNYNKLLPAARYKLAEQVSGRGVFSFCMCPGGIIVPSATDAGQVVVNGMSNSGRNSAFANSGIVVQVNPADIGKPDDTNPLKLLNFQEQLEAACMVDSKKPQTAPGQRLTDFVQGKISATLPRHSYHPGAAPYDLAVLLPKFISAPLKEAIKLFDIRMKGYYTSEAILLGVESRTSSPVRIPRKENYEHIETSGLFVCGEGSGYAGGITSSAIDGVNCALHVAEHVN